MIINYQVLKFENLTKLLLKMQMIFNDKLEILNEGKTLKKSCCTGNIKLWKIFRNLCYRFKLLGTELYELLPDTGELCPPVAGRCRLLRDRLSENSSDTGGGLEDKNRQHVPHNYWLQIGWPFRILFLTVCLFFDICMSQETVTGISYIQRL